MGEVLGYNVYFNPVKSGSLVFRRAAFESPAADKGRYPRSPSFAPTIGLIDRGVDRSMSIADLVHFRMFWIVHCS